MASALFQHTSQAQAASMTTGGGVKDECRAPAAEDGFRVDLSGGGNQAYFWGIAATEGRRNGMEDAHVVELDVDGTGSTALFGVFDGHAGAEAAAFCACHIVRVLVSTPAYASGDLEAALSQAYLKLDEMLMDPAHREELACLNARVRPSSNPVANQALADTYGTFDQEGNYMGAKAGCTACVALVRREEMYVANVGDSRCVLCEAGGRVVALTRDHKPELGDEQQRVVKAGFSVRQNRVCGVKSSLAMSRALGDTKYKKPDLAPEEQGVSPVPETMQYIVGNAASASCVPGDPAAAGDPGAAGASEFMLLACDGLWDCMSNKMAVSFARGRLQRGVPPQQAALALVEECLSSSSHTPTSTDNITVLIVLFEPVPGAKAAQRLGDGLAQ